MPESAVHNLVTIVFDVLVVFIHQVSPQIKKA
ncbi:MAG: hypothetical protein DVB22_002049 [Verrucomicrobia bacterium]|jgi:hypothetical protein|nr:MAG: hypothetical protein DVB22_002049 [Verrucomicrobiota bacterium]